ncbi:sugar phosphate nucleotidyltransferase [soil metagenome]
MKVIIPLAGKGARLRPHTHVKPKPLLRVADKPVMSYILDDLRELGVDEAIFITGHLKEKVEEYVRTEYPEFRAHFVEQAEQNGTAGAVELAKEFANEDLLIMFVDTLFDADLSLVRSLEPEAAGIIWVKEVEDYQRFGVVVTDDRGYMKQIIEKPSEPISKLANIGLYYIRDWKLLFQGIQHVLDSDPGASGEYYLTDAFQYMIDHGAKLKVVEVAGWYDAGKPETLLETNQHLLSTSRGRTPEARSGVVIREPVHVADDVELEECEIGPNVTISAGSSIRNSRLAHTIVGQRSVIQGCELRDSLIGDEVKLSGVKGQVEVGDHSVISNG